MGNCMCFRRAEVGPFDSYRKVTLDDFNIQRAIGKGAFGKVSIVQKRKGGQQYALKYINKAQCIAEKAVHHVVQERNLLEEIRHPFICNLRYSFQDQDNLYMALDLMTGGDLRFHLNKPLKEPACRVILAEIASALEYLHAHTIVHRDIKPDNILLDADGHAYLTDFNIAVKFREERPLKSVAGTEPYMAPELLLGNGYFASVDWWSLGVMAYEIMLGERPFRGKHKRDLIKKADWKFPKSASDAPPGSPTASTVSTIAKSKSQRERHPRITDAAKGLISGLMTVDVTKRLGCGPEGKTALRTHPFLDCINWEKLIAKEITPVFVPPRNKANFDATHDLEEILLNDNPLGSKSKQKKNDAFSTSPEMMVIERQFLYYDYARPDFVDSQATQASPVNSLDLIKLRESCVSVDSNKSSAQRSMTASQNSRSQQFSAEMVPLPHNASYPGARDPPLGVRRALSGAHDLNSGSEMLKAGLPRQLGMSAGATWTGTPSGTCLSPVTGGQIIGSGEMPHGERMILAETKAALRLDSEKSSMPNNTPAIPV
ncbi:hypothetical protein PhCBS80983_g02869 [Powellomyces hirtus]|uniref:Protein kinase domain-containing protein n=1 Tax=Powellomyces hirtus TaxID=109895 RepID=A0A507E4Y0_9FUNG|nr:hypothetical protein PhCBS80983_g02869 [Powellomyces hirtus]